jgi:FAD dependent oxidoreductase
MRSLLLSLFAYAAVADVDCDIFIAGGSLASMASAITAANVSSTLDICFTDITDWPGGQMTASAVPALDFGTDNSISANNAPSLNGWIFGPYMNGSTNLGECWVSTKCFEPQNALSKYFMPLLNSYPNLHIHLNTAISYVNRDSGSGNITSVVAIQRTPRMGTTGWEQLTSTMLDDWYDERPSGLFTKTKITFNIRPNGIVIEGTEFGDVLMTGNIPTSQGIETPYENSTTYTSYCGQGFTIPFYVTYSTSLAPSPDPVPAGSPEGLPYGQQGLSWFRDWSYRRVHAPNATDGQASPGETSVINVGGGNDFDNGYFFYPLGSPELEAQLSAPGNWRGGVNLTSYSRAENRSYGFYHWFKANASAEVSPYLLLNATQTGTVTGLAKMPYLRDSRRSAAGLNGFRVFKEDLCTANPPDNRTALPWPDTVGIGQYFYADIHKMTKETCTYPSYIDAGDPVKPYFLSFRQLTVQSVPNLLVVGKSMSMTFFANAAIRLHPEEWNSGTAAGAAAVLMVQRKWTSTDVYNNIGTLQALLESPEVALPQTWTFTN